MLFVGMAVAMARAVGAVGTARCVGEPRRSLALQRVLPRRADVGVLVVSSSSGDGAQLRCRAGTLTSAVRGLDTVDWVLEREGVEESRAALHHSFEAASVSGRVGMDECRRPVLDESLSRLLSSTAGVESAVDMAAEAHELQSRIYYGRRGGGDAYPGMATTNTDDDVQKGSQSEPMVVALEAALQGAGRNAETLCQLAMRAWHKLGDAERAEQLYMEALQLAPQDSAIQASYAQFLWQCDA